MEHIHRSWRPLRTLLATAFLAAFGGQASAFVFETESGWKGSFNNTLSVGSSWRAVNPDSALYSSADGQRAGYGAGGTGGANHDSGNLNWKKGERFSTPIQWVSELSVRRNDAGAFVRAKVWYDQALNHRGVHAGNADNNWDAGGKLSDASQPSLNKFDGVALLDAYVYNTFDVADKPLQLRVGRQVVNWGESLFIQGVNQLNPLNLPALTKPGTEIKEAFLPVWSLSGNLGLGGGASLEAFYQLKWERTIVDSCGGYWSPIEGGISTSAGSGCKGLTTTLPPADNFTGFNTGAYIPLGSGKKGKDSGQFGLAFRFPVEAIDSEVGLYAMQINSRVPIISTRGNNPIGAAALQAATAAAIPPFGVIQPIPALAMGVSTQGFWEYPDKIRIYGLSAATNLAGWSVGAEVSHTPNQPVQINGNDILFGALMGIGPLGADGVALANQGLGAELHGFDRMRKTQLQVNTIKVLPGMLGASQGLLLAEVGMQWNDLPDNGRRYGRAFIYGAASDPTYGGSTCGVLNPQADGCQDDGFVTRFSSGYRLKASLDYHGLIPSTTVTPSVSWAHDVSGYSSDSQFIKGRQILGLGIRFDYQKKYVLDLGYTTFNHDAKYDQFRDRDYYSAALSVTF